MKVAVAGASGLIGAQVADLLRADGHEVVGLSRSMGVDLRTVSESALQDRLGSTDVLVDVLSPPSIEQDAASAFYTEVATRLGRCASAVGVSRSVVLSIVGIEEGREYGFYAATLEHEVAVLENSPNPRVLRSTQFHEFPRRWLLSVARHGRAEVMDVPIQPIASIEVAKAVVGLCGPAGPGRVDLAGPGVERLTELVHHVNRKLDSPTLIVPVPGPPSLANGSMLAGPGAVIRGPDWHSWFRRSSS